MIRHENKDGNRRLSPTRSDSSASNCLAKTERRAPPDGASEAQVGGREVEVLQGIGSGLGRSHAEDGRHGARKINRARRARCVPGVFGSVRDAASDRRRLARSAGIRTRPIAIRARSAGRSRGGPVTVAATDSPRSNEILCSMCMQQHRLRAQQDFLDAAAEEHAFDSIPVDTAIRNAREATASGPKLGRTRFMRKRHAMTKIPLQSS